MRSLNDLEIVAIMELERYRTFYVWSLSTAESQKGKNEGALFSISVFSYHQRQMS